MEVAADNYVEPEYQEPSPEPRGTSEPESLVTGDLQEVPEQTTRRLKRLSKTSHAVDEDDSHLVSTGIEDNTPNKATDDERQMESGKRRRLRLKQYIEERQQSDQEEEEEPESRKKRERRPSRKTRRSKKQKEAIDEENPELKESEGEKEMKPESDEDFIVDDDDDGDEKTKKKAKNSRALDELAGRRKKPEKKSNAEMLAMFAAQADGLVAEESDYDEEKANLDRERNLAELEKINKKGGKGRSTGTSKGTTSTNTVKTKNKLFGDFNLIEMADGYDDERLYEEPEFLPAEELKIEKANKKKEITTLLEKVDQYRREKAIGDEIDIHKEIKIFKNPNTMPSTIQSLSADQNATQDNNSKPLPETQMTIENDQTGLNRLDSVPNMENNWPSMQNVSSIQNVPSIQNMGSTEFSELNLSKCDKTQSTSRSQPNPTQNSEISQILQQNEKLNKIEKDYLPEIEVTLPKNFARNPSLSIADSTMFITALSRSSSTIVNKSNLQLRGMPACLEVNKKKKTSIDLCKEISKDIQRKRSKNLSIEVLNSRFQKRELVFIDKKKEQAAKQQAENQESQADNEEEKDSEYNPEDENKENEEESNKKPVIDVARIKELEEGEEAEEESNYDEEEEEANDDEEDEDGEKNDEGESKDERSESDMIDESSNSNVKRQKRREDQDTAQKYLQEDSLPIFDDFQQHAERNESNSDMPMQNEKKLTKLKKIADRIMEKLTMPKKLKEQVEQKPKKKINPKFLDIEAEVGSDREENDDIVKEIDRNDAEENEDGLDQDLEELIDHNFEENEDEGEVFEKFLKDLWVQDKEQMRAVIERAFVNKKRKRGQFEIDVFEDERMKKKLKRMEEVMKALEERDNIYNDNYDPKINKNNDDDWLDNEELAGKHSILLKINSQFKKVLDRQAPATIKQDERIFFGEGIKSRIQKQNSFEKNTPVGTNANSQLNSKSKASLTNGSKPKGLDESPMNTTNFSMNKSAGPTTQNKAKPFVRQNSVLQVKEGNNNFNIFNNNVNKDVLNEYGVKNSLLGLATSNNQVNRFNNVLPQSMQKKPSTSAPSNNVSSLNKLYNHGADLKKGSPNKVSISLFAQRIKRN